MFTKKRYCALSSRPVVASWTAALKHTLTAFAADAALGESIGAYASEWCWHRMSRWRKWAGRDGTLVDV